MSEQVCVRVPVVTQTISPTVGLVSASRENNFSLQKTTSPDIRIRSRTEFPKNTAFAGRVTCHRRTCPWHQIGRVDRGWHKSSAAEGVENANPQRWAVYYRRF